MRKKCLSIAGRKCYHNVWMSKTSVTWLIKYTCHSLFLIQ